MYRQPPLNEGSHNEGSHNEGFILLPSAHLTNTKLALTKFNPGNFFQV
ncbi:hypothetical protein E2C01_028976 [Portunus trituberculatus]|uniref:Uncharacterized protein n=1 Tax=Portunus trituberculatus TaxID=210409 RepID=A0A5B7ELW3_PORTR|nr:hypothetical protein [Portunus trituberculatus]